MKPAKSIEDIIRIVPSLKEMADVSFIELENLDSTNLNPNHWEKLILEIQRIHDTVDAILITHGTDTMAYTASAVSLALGRGLKIPIVFTGSQLPLITFGTDARFNLENSMKTLIEASRLGIAEVMVVFNDRVLRASRSIKTSEASFLAFDSPAFPYLARIDAVGIHFIKEAIKADTNISLDIKTGFQRGILAIELSPGLEPDIVLEILKSKKCHGLLLKSFGAGNVPTEGEYSLLPVIQEAVSALNLPVLISTKFVNGRTHMGIYETGKKALDAGAMPTGDMTDVMAQVKLMWALAQSPKSLVDLKNMINTDFVGEITV